MNAVLTRTARVFELALALVFAAGVVLKGMDINLFAVQISAYGVIQHTQGLSQAALGTLALETFLAVMLLLGPRQRSWLHALVCITLVGFTFLIAYGWFFHDLEDCGCFGPLEMSPALSISKNVLLMLLSLAAWRGFLLRKESTPLIKGDVIKKIVVAAIVSISVMIGVSFTLESVESTPQPFAQFQFTSDFGFFDLSEGTFLVALLSMGCDHCKGEVPALNALLYEPDLPPVIGLCYEDFEGQINEFRNETLPDFPLHSLGTQTLLFFSLLGEDVTEPPRLVLVHDGAEVASWATTPDPLTLAETISEAGLIE